MIGRITLDLPFQHSFAGLHFYSMRQAGFSFTNAATLILAQNIKREIDELTQWVKENQTIYFAEMLWASYLANCQENYSKPRFTKPQILTGYMKLTDEKQRHILKVWNESMSFGAKPIPGAKKKNDDEVGEFSTLYYLCIGEVGLMPADFWKLTEGETVAKVRGFYFTQAYESDNFRSLYTIIHNTNVKRSDRRTKEQLWKLITDMRESKIFDHDELSARNSRIRGITNKEGEK